MAGQIYMDGLWTGALDKPEKANDVTPFVPGQVGKEVSLPSPTNSGKLASKTWKYVRRDGAACNAPYAVFHYSDVDDFVAGLAAAAGVPAGIFHGDDNASDVLERGVQVGNYGFLQVAGTSLVQCGAGVAAGDALMSMNNGTVDTATAGIPVIGIALEAVGATLANHVTVLLDIPRLTR